MTTYQVLARSCRPSTFDEVIGQEAISRTLVGAINEERVAHAYLFCGSRGVGKTSMARILARALNCEQGPTPTPCDACDPCRAIREGRDVDFIEIDGASNRGIDEIRNIRDNVRYRPAHSRYKIYLIDEVHMLTGPAFNALLKTLEEPPAHVKFLFATTEPHDVPETIRSRCQRFDFRRIPPSVIAAHLARVAAEAGIEAEREALTELARAARGSMRDGLVRLDQVRAFTGGAVTAEDVHQVLGTLPFAALSGWAEALAAGDVPGLFERIAGLYEAGADLEAFLGQWTEFLRDLLVVQSCGAREELLALALADESLERLAGSFSQAGLVGMIGMFLETAARLRKSSLPRVLLEAAFVRAALWEEWIPAGALAAALEGRPPSDPAGAVSARARLAAPPVETPPAPQPPVDDGPLDSARLARGWGAVLAQLEQSAPAFAPVLRKGQPETDGARIVVRFSGAENRFAVSRLEQPGQRVKIEDAVARAFGRPWPIELVQEEGSTEAPRTAAEVAQDDRVREVLQVFDGRVLDVRPAQEE